MQELADPTAFGGQKFYKANGRAYNDLIANGGIGYAEAAQTHLLGSHVYKWGRGEYEGDELADEAKYLGVFRHPYIVSYYGRCIDLFADEQDKHLRGLVLERMDTDLAKLTKAQG